MEHFEDLFEEYTGIVTVEDTKDAGYVIHFRREVKPAPTIQESYTEAFNDVSISTPSSLINNDNIIPSIIISNCNSSTSSNSRESNANVKNETDANVKNEEKTLVSGRKRSKTESDAHNGFIFPKNGIIAKNLISNEEDYKLILSEQIYKMNISLSEIPLNRNPNNLKGLIGIYRHAYPAKEGISDYGYLEETRVITSYNLYNGYLMLKLCPIVYIRNNICYYVAKNVVDLVLYNLKSDIEDDSEDDKNYTNADEDDNNDDNSVDVEEWVLVQKKYIFVRGCSFNICYNPILRTSVDNGQFVEKDGRLIRRSANRVIPKAFNRLFDEAENNDPIRW